MPTLDKSKLALDVRSVVKHFDSRGIRIPHPWVRQKDNWVVAVNDVSLQIERGRIVGIVGSNGCGKSTLIRIISTLLYPDRGTVEVFGYDVVENSHIVRNLINRVSVEASFFRKLSPMENLLFAGQTYGLNRSAIEERVMAILNRLGIKENGVFQPLEQMSRGMQQKVAVARGFLTSPILLLLDEPTTGLDPVSKRQVQDLIIELQEEHDATILLVTHDMDEAEKLCSRIAIMSEGRIVTTGSISELLGLAAEKGKPCSLESAFLTIAGHGLDEDSRKIVGTANSEDTTGD